MASLPSGAWIMGDGRQSKGRDRRFFQLLHGFLGRPTGQTLKTARRDRC